MKLFKKLLAAALASMLALSVLTGCEKTNSQTLIDALNQTGAAKSFALDTFNQPEQSEVDVVSDYIDMIVNGSDDELRSWAESTVGPDKEDEVNKQVAYFKALRKLPLADILAYEQVTEDAIYAIVDSNVLTVKQQAIDAVKHVKKKTLTAEGVLDPVECKLDTSKSYEVIFFTVTTKTKGSATLIVFEEATNP